MTSRGTDTSAGRLFVVATPIGNLDDTTPRAVATLKSVDAIAAEDTRRTRKLLSHFGIRTPLVAYHDHNEERAAREIVERMEGGADVALVSDAGTPLMSDPGYRIVALAAERGIVVVPIPGPSALVAALSVAALPPQPFYFAGYLPRKSGARRRRLEALKGLGCTVVFYESPHRIEAALSDMVLVMGDRRAVVARELTKVHEEVLRGALTDLRDEAEARQLKGEIVILVEGADELQRSGGAGRTGGDDGRVPG